VTEAEVLADRHPRGSERIHEHVLHELIGRLQREVRVEADHDQLPHAQRLDQLGLAL
jgi:hypothetical protein